MNCRNYIPITAFYLNKIIIIINYTVHLLRVAEGQWQFKRIYDYDKENNENDRVIE